MTKGKSKNIVKYLSLIDPKIKKEFLESIHDGSLLRLQKKEEKLTKNHPRYGLIQIINSFNDGKEKKDFGTVFDPYKFFEQKGPHYCAGYLSRFGYVINSHENDYFVITELKRNLRKILERKNFEAAKDVWNKHFI